MARLWEKNQQLEEELAREKSLLAEERVELA